MDLLSQPAPPLYGPVRVTRPKHQHRDPLARVRPVADPLSAGNGPWSKPGRPSRPASARRPAAFRGIGSCWCDRHRGVTALAKAA